MSKTHDFPADSYNPIEPFYVNDEDEWPNAIHEDGPPHREENEEHTHHPSLLEETDLAHFFGTTGPVAALFEGYELRPSQLQMAQAVKDAILARKTALMDAPTGTGKSMAYLLPAILSGRTVVVATANKSLQNQLYTKEIPFLSKVLGREINAVLVKGRSNYLCAYKWENEAQEQKQFALYDREDEQFTYLRTWIDETDSGDVDDLPFLLSADLRPRVVSFPDDCLQRNCRHFFDNCFVNLMRDRAANAQVLITNHHLLLNALELGEMGGRLLPPASIYVIDEAHQLEDTATSVFEVEVTNYTLPLLLARGVIKEYTEAERINDLDLQNMIAFAEVERLKDDPSFRIETELEGMKTLASQLKQLLDDLRQKHPYPKSDDKKKEDESVGEKRAQYDLALEALSSLIIKLGVIATASRDDRMVRYAERVFDRRHVRLTIHAAPIDPASYLREFLFEDEKRTVICTSATLATDGHFGHFKRRCGVVGETIERVLPPVFDYPNQALLYQPALPAYDWRNKEPYYDAVAHEIARLLEVSRGRALCLFTNWSGLQQVHARLKDLEKGVAWPMQAQGETPRNALLSWFVKTPHSVLLATRSFWEGVDLPGDDLSLVVLDKMPFPTPNDPLHSARMQRLDAAVESSSFGDYMLPLMNLTLKQGFGRLVRRSTDRGVVAILDERLTSKSYGRRTREDLPPARFSRNFRDVHGFFREALGSRADFALNVHAWEDGASVRWRWQLFRLQDGAGDGESGSSRGNDRATAEIEAAVTALHNLKGRIDRAGRKPNNFGVELRCSAETELALVDGVLKESLRKKWINESAIWGAFHVIGLKRQSELES
ncbi:MAG: ATP-dependent DNA helicase [Caldilineaceae bacterium]|nr:ATP-dependent DNA helicase [Caldilineaceae bacterium]